MKLAVRFRYFEARVPSFDIVDLNNTQWRAFLQLERSYMRRDWMIRFLHREKIANEIAEMWWIPLNDQNQLLY